MLNSTICVDACHLNTIQGAPYLKEFVVDIENVLYICMMFDIQEICIYINQ